MDFAKLASLSVGLAAFLGGLWIVLQIIKSIRRNGNGKNISKSEEPKDKSGDRTPEEWEGRMAKLRDEGNEQLMKDIRNLLDARNEKIRQIIREEFKR